MKATNTTEFISDLNAGVFADQIGHALSEVAAGVVETGKVGTVTIIFTMKQIASSHQVEINQKLTYRAPTRRGDRSENTVMDTPMYVGEGGQLTLFPRTPSADLLFDLRAVRAHINP